MSKRDNNLRSWGFNLGAAAAFLVVNAADGDWPRATLMALFLAVLFAVRLWWEGAPN